MLDDNPDDGDRVGTVFLDAPRGNTFGRCQRLQDRAIGAIIIAATVVQVAGVLSWIVNDDHVNLAAVLCWACVLFVGGILLFVCHRFVRWGFEVTHQARLPISRDPKRFGAAKLELRPRVRTFVGVQVVDRDQPVNVVFRPGNTSDNRDRIAMFVSLQPTLAAWCRWLSLVLVFSRSDIRTLATLLVLAISNKFDVLSRRHPMLATTGQCLASVGDKAPLRLTPDMVSPAGLTLERFVFDNVPLTLFVPLVAAVVVDDRRVDFVAAVWLGRRCCRR